MSNSVLEGSRGIRGDPQNLVKPELTDDFDDWVFLINNTFGIGKRHSLLFRLCRMLFELSTDLNIRARETQSLRNNKSGVLAMIGMLAL
jgi:hypothetical protein